MRFSLADLAPKGEKPNRRRTLEPDVRGVGTPRTSVGSDYFGHCHLISIVGACCEFNMERCNGRLVNCQQLARRRTYINELCVP